jgi:putative addiction module killer protein
MVEPIRILDTPEYRRWLRDLKDKRSKTRIAARMRRVEQGLFGNTRSVGGGVSELKFDFGPGHRVYYGRKGQTIILLLCGGDKSTQSHDVNTAHKIWDQWKDNI